MKTIEIDEELYAYLQSKAIAFVENENLTIKRLLGLTKNQNTVKRSNTVKTKKMRKTNLSELINAGILNENQKLVFHDYQNHSYPEYEVNVYHNSLQWEGNIYSMSDLAKILLKKHGYESDSVRGPMFWYTQDGISIKDLWIQYNN